MKSTWLYPVYFQSSAGHPQAGDRILCHFKWSGRAKATLGAGFAPLQGESEGRGGIFDGLSNCENLADAMPGKGSGKSRSNHETRERANEIAALRRADAEHQRPCANMREHRELGRNPLTTEGTLLEFEKSLLSERKELLYLTIDPQVPCL